MDEPSSGADPAHRLTVGRPPRGRPPCPPRTPRRGPAVHAVAPRRAPPPCLPLEPPCPRSRPPPPARTPNRARCTGRRARGRPVPSRSRWRRSRGRERESRRGLPLALPPRCGRDALRTTGPPLRTDLHLLASIVGVQRVLSDEGRDVPMAKHWADFQYEIYLGGMSGAVP